MKDELQSAMIAAVRAGISIIPIDHRTKRPAAKLLPGGKWKPYQERTSVMLLCMTNVRLLNIHALSRQLGLSVTWLTAEARAGRIPCLRVGRKLLFNLAAVQEQLSARAAQERAPEGRVQDAH